MNVANSHLIFIHLHHPFQCGVTNVPIREDCPEDSVSGFWYWVGAAKMVKQWPLPQTQGWPQCHRGISVQGLPTRYRLYQSLCLRSFLIDIGRYHTRYVYSHAGHTCLGHSGPSLITTPNEWLYTVRLSHRPGNWLDTRIARLSLS